MNGEIKKKQKATKLQKKEKGDMKTKIAFLKTKNINKY